MARRLTKHELDEQFELFLKESVSDDSDKQPGAKSSQKSSQKAAVPWWQEDEHSGGGTGREVAKSRFIKAKKSQHENDNVVSAEPFYTPVPKPRRKASDKAVHLETPHRDTVLRVSRTVGRHRTLSEGSDGASSENLQCVSGERSPDETLSDDTAPASTDSHSQGDGEDGLLGSGKTFRKSLRKSVGQEDEDQGDAGLKEDGPKAAALSKDEPVMLPAANTTAIGLDTIEEEEEKARFFAQLEAGALSTIDYSILNRELDSTSSTVATNLRRAEEAVEQSDDDDDDDEGKAGVPEAVRESPASPHYSEDFEEEENRKELSEENSKLSPILAKGQSYVQSGASDMEALHEAYRQIHVVEDSDDHHPHGSYVEGRGRINRAVSPSSPPPRATQSLQPASTDESELPTAEELMRPIRPERDHLRGFTLQPVSAGGPEDQEKTPRFLERTFPVVTPPDSQVKPAEQADPVGGRQAARGLTCSSPDPPNLMWSIRQEVEKLMQDQNKYSSTSSQTGKAKKQQASHGSAVSHSSTSSVRKPTGAPMRGRRVEGWTAGTSRASGLSRAAASAKTQPSVSRPLQHPREKAKVTKSQEKEDYTAEPGLRASSELVASVQSLVAVLQQQIDTSSPREASDAQEVTRLTHRLPNNREEDGSVVEELRGQLAHKESELQMMKGGAEELNSLRQQNYLLHSKLRSAEEASQKKRWAEATDSAAEGKLQQIDKEIKEQETLIKGYQQVERLKVDVGKRGSEQQRKTKEKTLDTKRMQDLERQVKELEQILRGRNPNSLPALIYAAAAAGCQEDAAAKTPPPPSRINALLERRIQRLEAELEGHDEEAKRGLQAMQQQFHRIKLRYEQQISELEQQLDRQQQLEAARPEPPSQAGPLEEELRCVVESHQEREKCLQDQIESLQQQLKHTVVTGASQAQPSPNRHRRQAEAAFGARIERLNNDLASKTRTVQELCRTVERLQRERRNMMFIPNPRTETRPTETKRQPAKTLRSAPAGGEETFPAAHCEKTYQPTVFTGSHISEVVQENEALKQLVERLQLQSEQEGEALRSDARRAKEELCRLQGQSAEQLSSMRAEHLRVLDQLRAAHALEHASSKVAELANKLNTQEITVKHLREQLKEVQGAKEALAISRTREDALQKQLTRLLEELKEAKEAQSPEVKLLCGLERKIFNMELRHQHREQELQQVIGGSWQTSEADQQVESWKRLAMDKSRELEAFRLELDSILDILRHLQRQGVVLPHS